MKSLVKRLALLMHALLYRDATPKVVYYHDVGVKYTPMGTDAQLFWSHMAYLINHQPPTNHEVAFDDGFLGIWDEREKFKAMGIKPIVFLAVDLVGKPGYLNWDEVRILQWEYGFNFQCHTWSHQTLVGPINTDLPRPATETFRTDAWYQHELVDSKLKLEEELNRLPLTGHQQLTTNNQRYEVTSLCFPLGYFSDDVICRCAEAGYKHLYASFPGNAEDCLLSIVHLHLDSPPSLHPRCLAQCASLCEFKAILNGGMNSLRNHYLRMHLK